MVSIWVQPESELQQAIRSLDSYLDWLESQCDAYSSAPALYTFQRRTIAIQNALITLKNELRSHDLHKKYVDSQKP